MEEVILKTPCDIMKTGTQDEIKAYLAALNNLSIPEIISLLKNNKDKDDYFLLYYVWQKISVVCECGFQNVLDAANAANSSAKKTLFKACDEQNDTVRLHRFLKEGMDPRLLSSYFDLDGYLEEHDGAEHYVRALFLLEYGARAKKEETRKKLLRKILEINLDGAERCLENLFQQDPSIFQRTYAFFRAAHDGKVVIVNWLLQHGIDANTQHEETGDTALHWASTFFVAKCLLRHGALVDARNKNQTTPLHRAILRNDTRVAEFLVKSGADITARDMKGLSYMVMAIEKHMHELLQCLIAHGADIDEVLEGESTLIDCAVRAGNDIAVEILAAAKEKKRFEGAGNQSPRGLVLGDSPILSRGVKNMSSFPEELSKLSPRNP